MKLLVLAGNQPRHHFLVNRLLENYPDAAVAYMTREPMIPSPPAGTVLRDVKLFNRHFDLRLETEAHVFGNSLAVKTSERSQCLHVSSNELNSNVLAEFILVTKADVCIVFGTDLIKDPVLSCLPEMTFNVHLGLSPWYRGSATLFWPFYFLEPQLAGATVHRLVAAVDGGEIAFQTSPKLETGMGIHDVGCATVLSVAAPLLRLLETINRGTKVVLTPQRSSGRIFRMRDFRPPHLRINYELFDDRMVDAWLCGELGGDIPDLVDCFGD